MDDAQTGSSGIPLYSPDDFAGMRRAGQTAAATLDFITPHVKAGVRTIELNDLMERFIVDHGAICGPLNYRGYPKATCISVNHVVCHGIPGDKRLQEGDIVNIDVTPVLDGWFGDSSRMYLCGEVSVKARKLVDVTYDAMMLGIAKVKPGATFGDIGHAIQSFAESQRFSVVRDFSGHGVGRKFHEPPKVRHHGRPGEGPTLQEGMIFTIEPMINAGGYAVKVLSDGWTAVTRDKSLSAQFEHTVGVTRDGCEIFTLSPAGHTKPPYF
ncbi:type I methionyl aminopeptidase [Rhodomicrobium lacus]|uniref:type I methionyl aminopeptidase n=1 Tax=Rhodomicrobium lacus TaxID=2498452 RepID=UPI0026E1FAC5|nr:type I methionyl aminopeptidase [Rhodomicrobium lacus]WKW49418.1 type I methionyl aminopeptidase [Rhodomicrobium lacus]